jgi:deoxyribodipyrimidine photo-lyase
MTLDLDLDLSPATARERLARVDAAAYAATRNHLQGAVSGLSPWIVHGALSLREALAAVHARTPLPLDHRWVQELAWRGFFQHRLMREPDTVWHSRHEGPLPEGEYAAGVCAAEGQAGVAPGPAQARSDAAVDACPQEGATTLAPDPGATLRAEPRGRQASLLAPDVARHAASPASSLSPPGSRRQPDLLPRRLLDVPADVREARTGLAVIDQAVRTLATTGWLHNHARLWLASYLVHGRRVHWRAGADWMLSWLMDGDVGPNHGSWQWVAGTGSHKPYLFNADNVARFAPKDWQVPGSLLDTGYDAHEARARGALPALPAGQGGEPLAGPEVSRLPPLEPAWGPDLRGRRVWLTHPWSLGDPPPGFDAVVALWPLDAWTNIAWRRERWAAVARRLQALTPWQWVGSAEVLAGKLAGARPSGIDHPCVPLPLRTLLDRPADSLFPALDRPDAPVASSFSAYWRLGTRHLRSVDELLVQLD